MGTHMIHVERHNQVAVIQLNRSVTNALNPQLVNELAEALRSAKHDPDVHSLVLSSANEKFFSIGFDIPQLFELSQEDFEVFFKAFNRVCLDLYTLPKPTVAAMPGHAIAGRCILALCCDYRFIAQGQKLMGLNEIKLGVPVPYLADCVLQRIAGARHARTMMDTGEFYPPAELLSMGVVDQVLPLEQVLPRSIEKAGSVGALPQPAFAMIKRNRTEAVEAQVLARLEEKMQFFIECWYSDVARERLKEAIARF